MKSINVVVCALVACVALGWSKPAAAQQYELAPHLFANQYTQGFSNQATAQMYVAPVPVPAWVGHTYYTYQPLYPHEMMSWHNERFHSYYDNGRGLTRVGVHYYSPPLRTAGQRFIKQFSIARP